MATWQVSLDATLIDGVLTLNRRHLQDALRGRRDGPVAVTIEPLKAARSPAQNRLYWSVYVKTLSDHTGYPEDEMHEILKGKFLPKALTLTNANGEIVDEFVIGGSTTKLSIEEFMAYLDRIHLWAIEKLGVVIPEPGRAIA